MRRVLVLAAVFLGALLAVPQAPADDEPGATAAARKGSKAKKKCKKGQVRVRSGKRSSCVRQPKSPATVTPRAEDPRLAAIKAGLTPAIVSAPDPKGQLPPPMEKVYRSFGPRALKGMETAVARSLPKLATAAARPRLLARPASAWSSAGSGSGYSENIGGGMRIDVRLNIAAVASAEFALTRTRDDGRTLTVTYELPILSDGYDGFRGDPCPDADGKLKAKDGLGITVRSELRSDGGKTLDEYLLYKVVDKTDLRAEVGDDAKLDRLEINNIQEVDETVFSSAIYSGAQVKATIVREGTVDMRSGNLNTTINNVDAAVSLAGIASLFPASNRAGIVARMKQAADEGWKAVVKTETDKFKELEAAWLNPNACAKIEFGKANGTITFHRNETGSESARVDAKPGGSPAKASWEMRSQSNAFVTPPSGTANPNSFSFKVVNAGPGVEVQVTLKSVSKAGVAEKTWSQKTEQTAVNKIVGAFTQRFDLSGSVFEISGSNLVFERAVPPVNGPVDGLFKLASGLYTYTASGNANQIGVGPKCSVRGSGQFALQKESAFTVFGQKLDGEPPFDYTFSVGSDFVGGLPPMVDIETFGCAPEAGEFEGKHFQWPASVGFFTSLPRTSADGITYSGSVTTETPPLTVTETWSFEGEQ